MHEFLLLHYLATDRAQEWDIFLDSCLARWRWVCAGPRRALALHIYTTSATLPPLTDDLPILLGLRE